MTSLELTDISEKVYNCILTVGTFDGVHSGHQQIIQAMHSIPDSDSLPKVVITFKNHPRNTLQQYSEIKLLTTQSEKCSLLENFGIGYTCFLEFTREFSLKSPEEFIDEVIVPFKPKYIVIGREHYFGNRQEGNIETLRKSAKEFGFRIIEVEEFKSFGEEVSSTQIRKHLKCGNIESASKLLGYKYIITGTVIHGMNFGKTLGFPTANIMVDEDKLLPAPGVYAVKVSINNKCHYGMLYIGTRPTLGKSELSIEIHIFNFREDIYYEDLKVELIQRLRGDRRFGSLTELTAQIKLDLLQTQTIIQHEKTL